MMSGIYYPFTTDTYFHKASITFSNIAEIFQLAFRKKCNEKNTEDVWAETLNL